MRSQCHRSLPHPAPCCVSSMVRFCALEGHAAGERLTGPHGPLTLREAFEGRRQLIAYYFM